MEEEKNNNSANPFLIPSAIVMAGALIAGALVYSNMQPGSTANQASQTAGTAAVTGGTGTSGNVDLKGLEDDDPILGNPQAPVAVVEFSDFQCPFCRRLFRDTLPMLKEKYIKTGKVKFIYRDFPLTSIHSLAQKYAEAGECADEEGKFWQMHDKIFAEQDLLGEGTIVNITVEDMKQWAREIGLDKTRFDGCLDSGKYADEVARDFSDGQRLGVQGTPGTFVNGRLISGAVPLAIFEQAIEEELAKAK